MSIGLNIRELREERDLTQEYVAEALNVSFQTVSSWERDAYLPSTMNVIKLAKLFDVSISSIVEEEKTAFKFRETIYNWQHMKTYVKTTAKHLKMKNTLKAIDYAYEAHKEQTRKKSKVPYIYHPLNIACHALSMGIKEDEIIAACLLHDVIEDCGKTIEELPVNDETKEIVRLLTHEKIEESKRDKVLKKYYHAIAKNPKAALVKCLDRCNNLTTMSWGLTRHRSYRMIKETEEYFPKLLKILKDAPEYNSASWLLTYQIESMLDIYKRLL